MEIAVVVDGMPEPTARLQPWMHYREQLAAHGYQLRMFAGDAIAEAFTRPYDAMMIYIWLDWRNRRYFEPRRTMRMLERHATYRIDFPQTKQIVVNHTDMARRPFAHVYWRPDDPVLYRTPAYDRSLLHPLPARSIWPYEMVWGTPALFSPTPPAHLAGFIGTGSGPAGYRERVARETAKVGIGCCLETRAFPTDQYYRLLADCQIIVCPRGWGEQSLRHWDAWLSGKPVLTDRDCDSVEMIPGIHLRAGEHYLVYDEPEEIPDLVRHWTHPSRSEELTRIAEQGRLAARSYDALANLITFFERTLVQ